MKMGDIVRNKVIGEYGTDQSSLFGIFSIHI